MQKPLGTTDENRLLSRITFATSLGDFLSYFAVLIIVQDLTQNTALAAYSVAVKTLAIALGGALFPRVASRRGFRTTLIWSQGLSGLLILAVLALYELRLPWSAPGVLGLLFLQTILRQFFDGARESRSRLLGDVGSQRGLQAQLLQGFYSAQVLGPLMAFFLIRHFDVRWPLILDACSFFIAAFLCRSVGHDQEVRRYRLMAPLKALSRGGPLLWIFLIRSVGMWIPIGIFNYILFAVVVDHYGLDLLNSAWVYIAIGVGSYMASTWLRLRRGWLSERQDSTVAVFGFAILALTRLAFMNLPDFYLALGVMALGGVCNGANAVVTQSLRRKICSPEQLPEVMGLEILVGRLADWGVSTLLLFLFSRGLIGYREGIWASFASLCVLTLAMWVFRLRYMDPSRNSLAT
jgi:hypothetical protein